MCSCVRKCSISICSLQFLYLVLHITIIVFYKRWELRYTHIYCLSVGRTRARTIPNYIHFTHKLAFYFILYTRIYPPRVLYVTCIWWRWFVRFFRSLFRKQLFCFGFVLFIVLIGVSIVTLIIIIIIVTRLYTHLYCVYIVYGDCGVYARVMDIVVNGVGPMYSCISLVMKEEVEEGEGKRKKERDSERDGETESERERRR